MSSRVETTERETQVFAYVRGTGLNFTNNRRAILAVFLAGTEPVTITDLWLRTKKADPRTSHSTVWRLLKALVARGLAHREISPADGILRYAPVKVEMHSPARGVQRLRCHHLPGRRPTFPCRADAIEEGGRAGPL
jgi:Fe2+ or Zn2+ uptake regulation protein